jgi:hypothetical protein
LMQAAVIGYRALLRNAGWRRSDTRDWGGYYCKISFFSN